MASFEDDCKFWVEPCTNASPEWDLVPMQVLGGADPTGDVESPALRGRFGVERVQRKPCATASELQQSQQCAEIGFRWRLRFTVGAMLTAKCHCGFKPTDRPFRYSFRPV